MTSPSDVVREFCSAFATKDLATIERLLDDKAVYHNVGMEPAVGKDASIASIKGFLDMSESLGFEIHHLAAEGDTVLTERTDTMTVNGIAAPIAVMGAFDVRDGLIVAWRDYFDMGARRSADGGRGRRSRAAPDRLKPVAADPLDLTGRTAIVTGGGTGIGAATARLLAEHGADLVIASRTEAELEQVALSIRDATGRRCVPVRTDVKQEDDIVRMVERTMEELGRIDILVNNAGGTRLGPLEELPTRGWDSIFELNVRGPFLCTREVGRHMIEQGSGAIVNVSSGAGVTGVKGGAHYSAAKSGLQMFTRVTAAEWGPHGIRCNCVAVGLVGSERAVAAWEVAQPRPRADGDQRPARAGRDGRWRWRGRSSSSPATRRRT